MDIVFSLISKLININFVKKLLNKIKDEKRVEAFINVINGVKKSLNDQINALFNGEISKLQKIKLQFIEEYINPALNKVPGAPLIKKKLYDLVD